MSQFTLLLPNIQSLHSIIRTLNQLDIHSEQIQLFAENQDHVELSQLLDGSLFETSDLSYSLIRGALLGGIMGFVTGFLILKTMPPSLELENSILVAAIFVGIILGSWASSLIGVSVPSPHLESFEKALDNGEAIILINVANAKDQRLIQTLKYHHPEIKTERVGQDIFSNA